MAYKVLLVDDHRILRDGVKAMLNASTEFVVSAEAETGDEAIRICATNPPDLVVMDVGVAGLNGIEATHQITRQAPEVKVVMLSIYDDEYTVTNSIRAGARGYVLKRASGGALMDALRAVAKGGSYLSPEVSNRLLQRIQQGSLESQPSPSALDELSPRELQILRLVADGKSSKEIAALLNIGLQTVRGYRKTMMKKLGVNNVAGLTQWAISAGLTRYSAAMRGRHH